MVWALQSPIGAIFFSVGFQPGAFSEHPEAPSGRYSLALGFNPTLFQGSMCISGDRMFRLWLNKKAKLVQCVSPGRASPVGWAWTFCFFMTTWDIGFTGQPPDFPLDPVSVRSKPHRGDLFQRRFQPGAFSEHPEAPSGRFSLALGFNPTLFQGVPSPIEAVFSALGFNPTHFRCIPSDPISINSIVFSVGFQPCALTAIPQHHLQKLP
ncbi:MAG: hypothetical protein RIF36_21535 [Imperialibacter sp.]|uniref:hypothetical protein n=1 Tax=Imperialibacter sp. TaxID=2038411 RepID=UPI0032ECA110